MSQTPEQSSDTAIDATWLNWLPIIAGLLALILISNYILIFYKLPINENSAALGAFGDYIGGLLNPLIPLFTLIVAMKVWNLQKIELMEMRKAVKEQGETAEQQRQEQRFFDLLNLYQETLKTFVIEGVTGKAALNNWHKLPNANDCYIFLFIDRIEQEKYKATSIGLDLSSQKVIIMSSWDKFSPIFDHYFRTIFSILRELEELLPDDYIRYGKLFRAQLSRDELTLLAFNLLFDTNGKKMRPLVAKYGLLKHLAPGPLRQYATKNLDTSSFGRKWAAKQSAALSEATPC